MATPGAMVGAPRHHPSMSHHRTIHAALRERYVASWPNLVNLMRTSPGLSNPLLVAPTPAWIGQSRRLLVVGQQTGPDRWQPDYDARLRRPHCKSVVQLMTRYSNFQMNSRARTSHFWRFMLALARSLRLEPDQVLWLNLNRCDHEGARPAPRVEDDLWDAFPVLCDELEILRPTIVVFVTGPNFDSTIERRIHATLRPVRGFSRSALALVESAHLPCESFRTFHPNYLCRFRALDASKILGHFARIRCRR